MDDRLRPISQAYEEFEQHYPQPGWVEHDPEEIWKTTLKTIRKAAKKADLESIAAIGITNQRETICFWDRTNGKPLSRAIVWQDRRTSAICQQLKDKGAERFFQESTGLLLDPYFSGTKVNWAFENWPEIRKAYKEKKLAVGTIDSYLIFRLSDGAAHVTEPSNASRTLAYHLTRHQWDTELCTALGIPTDIWPEVLPSVGRFAQTRNVPGLPDGIPITGVLGDQQSALLGQACTREGTAKCTYGTGTFILLNTGNKPAVSRHRLISTIAWSLGKNEFTYALEGSAFIAGAAVQWLRDGLKLIKKSSDVEKLALTVDSSDGLTFVPALTGLGAPYWDPHARGMFTGITRGTTAGHFARAVLEGIAFQNVDIINAMQKDLGKPLTYLNIDGGASANDLMMQFQADVLGLELRRPKVIETTVLGAVFAAGLGAGIWSDFDEISKTWKEDRKFLPAYNEAEREEAMNRWRDAISRVTDQKS